MTFKPTDLAERYRTRGHHVLIEIRLHSMAQLFNTLDPSPFYEKDIDADAEEYIVGSVRDISLKRPLILVLHLPPAQVRHEDAGKLADAIRNYFRYKLQHEQRQLRHTFRQGRFSLLIGLVFLGGCIGIESLLEVFQWIPAQFPSVVVKESLLIGGWVAMWRPIQIFLYDWWPIRIMISVYRKLTEIDVEIEPDTESNA